MHDDCDRLHGYLTGPIIFDDGNVRHDLHATVWVGPQEPSSQPLRVISHAVKFILVVEKRGGFNRLVDDGFPSKNSCLVASGNGYLGRSFAKVLRQLHEQLNVPLYVLADNDPAGYLLYFLIARGTGRRASQPKTSRAFPGARYVGLRAEDFQRMRLPITATISLSETEREALHQLKLKPWLSADSAWQHELDQMQRNNFKVEVEALCSISPQFLGEDYLPERLQAGDYLEL